MGSRRLGGGWNYNPDNLPTGGELFETGAASNAGEYSNATDNANIAATHVAPTHAAEISALFKYENYLATQLPVIWVPEAPEQLTMYSNRLRSGRLQNLPRVLLLVEVVRAAGSELGIDRKTLIEVATERSFTGATGGAAQRVGLGPNDRCRTAATLAASLIGN